MSKLYKIHINSLKDEVFLVKLLPNFIEFLAIYFLTNFKVNLRRTKSCKLLSMHPQTINYPQQFTIPIQSQENPFHPQKNAEMK